MDLGLVHLNTITSGSVWFKDDSHLLVLLHAVLISPCIVRGVKNLVAGWTCSGDIVSEGHFLETIWFKDHSRWDNTCKGKERLNPSAQDNLNLVPPRSTISSGFFQGFVGRVFYATKINVHVCMIYIRSIFGTLLLHFQLNKMIYWSLAGPRPAAVNPFETVECLRLHLRLIFLACPCPIIVLGLNQCETRLRSHDCSLLEETAKTTLNRINIFFIWSYGLNVP